MLTNVEGDVSRSQSNGDLGQSIIKDIDQPENGQLAHHEAKEWTDHGPQEKVLYYFASWNNN